MIDDELVILIRIRITDELARDVATGYVLDELPKRLHEAVQQLIDPQSAALAGIEITMPTFQPYQEVPPNPPATTSP